ncbi:putative serine protease K12H4.7 [Neocloeon triangulifer]|uniref:putative serine protease K12H4.7 n=1 Tax=Neocloeon triangulifer TaxID=2078957 RepID=UPI00286F0460|nr:putative serine protease K12H4.7 [Neocloeon triangulifer]
MLRLKFVAIFLLLAKLSTCHDLNAFDLIHGDLFESHESRAFEEKFITQKLDQLNIFDDRTWQQRYFSSNQNYTSGSPILLVLGGEWEARPSVIENGFLGQLAANLSAYTIYLEHRFYGQSRPLPDLTLESLSYLTLEQAFEDTAVFVQTLKNQGFDGKWILVGASYSAVMASWARARYPHLYHAAYASGATVLAVIDIPEYFEVMGKAFEDTDPNCPLVIQTGMSQLKDLVQRGESATITSLFNLAEPINLFEPDDVYLLYYTVSQVYGLMVQGADPGTLEAKCSALIAGQDTPLQTFAQVYNDHINNASLSVDASKVVEKYQNTNYTRSFIRQWMFQACTEFGWFNSVFSPNQPFGPIVPLFFLLKFCTSVYGPEFTSERLDAGIERTNMLYGGLNPEVTRVIYTVGSIDPFNPAMLSSDVSADAPTVIIEGGSHCNDLTNPAKPDDPDSFIDARTKVIETLAAWLAVDV